MIPVAGVIIIAEAEHINDLAAFEHKAVLQVGADLALCDLYDIADVLLPVLCGQEIKKGKLADNILL